MRWPPGLHSWSSPVVIYINDTRDVSKVLDFILFADDTNIFFSHKNVDSIQRILNDELPKLSDWCNTNKVFANQNMTKFMPIFKPRQKRQKHLNPRMSKRGSFGPPLVFLT